MPPVSGVNFWGDDIDKAALMEYNVINNKLWRERARIMRYARIALGILLLIGALGGLYLWETAGRSRLMMDEVLVAARDLNAGAIVEEAMLAAVEMPKAGAVKKGFRRGEEQSLLGKELAYPVNAKQQFTTDSFVDETKALKENESYFVIPADWIAMRSSAVRRGDKVEILGENAADSFGTHKLAFVKNAYDVEIKDLSPRGEAMLEPMPENRRVDADSMIDHVEIITTAKTYYEIKAYVEKRGGTPCLVLVRAGR
jgi:hypothetical protein